MWYRIVTWFKRMFGLIDEHTYKQQQHNDEYHQFLGERLPDGRHRFYKKGDMWVDRKQVASAGIQN